MITCPLWVKSGHVQCKTSCPLWVQKRTRAVQKAMSALGSKADTCSAKGDVRFVPKATCRRLFRTASHTASLQRGYLWTASSRDEAAPPLTGVAGRLERALDNFSETFPLFAATVLAAHVAGVHSWMTEWGVQLYFWARVAYVAFYAAGLFLVRSLVWNVGTLGIILILLSLT